MQTLRSLVYPIRITLVFVGVTIGLSITAAEAEAQAETFVVTNTLNAGPGSLREAIGDANDSEADTKTITFSVDENQTILLLSALPDIEDGVTINGSTAVNLTVDGGGALRIFRVEADTTVVKDLGLEGAPLEIASGAKLSFDLSEDQQFDEVITDAGGLIKDGEATLTLRGTNDYAGGTEVRKGTLVGDTTSLQGSITNNALVVFDQDANGEYVGAIAGSGVVQKTGTGEVTFSGVNTYSGGTTVSEGVLRGDTGSLQGNIAVEAGGEVIFDDGVNATYAGNLTGAGKFTKSDDGTLTLTGENTISGEASLEAGGLRGGFASIPQNLSTGPDTLVIFEHNDDGTYAGAISGDADVTKDGTGTLTMSGSNTYTGLTTVILGTLRANPLNLPNETTSKIEILNNTALIFDSTGTGTYQGAISGAGSLTKMGAGTLSLTGTHTFTGLTSITAGRLDVDGSLAGGVDVGASGVLGGTGTISGTVNVDGIVAPGKSIGTLSVNRVIFTDTSIFQVEVDELTASADLLAVTGTADLGGATLQVDPGQGSYGTPVTVTILTAGTRLGEFEYEDDFVFLTITPTYGDKTVVLEIIHNGEALSEFGDTPNQRTIAIALDEVFVAAQMEELEDSDIEEVFDSLFGLTESQIPPALDAMTGETLTQFATARLATADRFGRSLDAKIRDHQWDSNQAFFGSGAGAESHTSADPTRPEGSPVLGVAMLGVGAMAAPGVGTHSSSDSWIRTWMEGSGIYGDVDGNSNESDFDYTIWSGSLGGDLLLAEHWVLGLAGGYANTDLDFSARPGEGGIDTYQGAVYAGYVDPRFHVGVSGRYAHNEMDGKRDIVFGAVNRSARADLDGDDYGARFESGINLFNIGGFVIQPTASVNYNHLTQDAFTESGAVSLNLAVDDFDLDSLVTGVGARVRGRWELDQGLWIVPELHGRWLHEFLDTDRLINARLVGPPMSASAFQIQGVELPRDSGSVGFTWSVITDGAWSMAAGYDIILNEDLVQHVGSFALNFEW